VNLDDEILNKLNAIVVSPRRGIWTCAILAIIACVLVGMTLSIASEIREFYDAEQSRNIRVEDKINQLSSEPGTFDFMKVQNWNSPYKEPTPEPLNMNINSEFFESQQFIPELPPKYRRSYKKDLPPQS
jgi:hypothetical protein|tara:strand:+ start:241 stop:627 length:387 start_codon:yes stop_codon:yes gene_type:complete